MEINKKRQKTWQGGQEDSKQIIKKHKMDRKTEGKERKCQPVRESIESRVAEWIFDLEVEYPWGKRREEEERNGDA